MESESLFVEEAEPPGRLTDEIGLEQNNLPNVPCSLRRGSSSRSAQKERAAARRIRAFRERFYPTTTNEQWNDWRWQLGNRICDLGSLERILVLSDEERHALSGISGVLPVAVTPYYASLLDRWDPKQPLRRTVVPTVDEHFRTLAEAEDPLHEDKDSPVPGIVHRYPDRVLFLVTGNCSTYCRYCTRSRLVGRARNTALGLEQWEKGLSYIASHREVRDVLLSGGDPLTLADEQLEWLLMRLRQIPHVEIIRLGTKTPAVLPQRITPNLVRMLRRYHPLWMSIHATHPDELTPQMAVACTRLADAGIPVGSQTVLLAGINDDLETMKRLLQGLLQIRVRPYYLYQCDPIPGSSHFRTPVSKGLEVIQGLRGFTSGYAVPTYVIDAPGGGGKIPLLPDYCTGRKDGNLILRNYEGREFFYPDCPSPEGVVH